MRTVLAVGVISAGLYASVLGLVPAPAQTTATSSLEATADGAAQEPAPEVTPEAVAQEPAPEAAPDGAAQEPGPEDGAAPSASPEPTATPVASATPEAPSEPPAASAKPAATPEATPAAPPASAVAEAAATPEPAAVGSPEPGVAVAPPVKARRRPGGRVNTTAGEGAVRRAPGAGEPRRGRTPTLTLADGSPAPSNPDFSLAVPGVAPIGVPDFFIDKFRIPPFLLPIYQAAGVQYGVQWEVLAAINEIETDYGRNLNVSSAGAVGWMQFMPSTWEEYGVDASGDGVKDPYNPVDAIFAAARYLKAAGG